MSEHNARYGWAHRKKRAAIARDIELGGVLCARCGLPIEPGTPFDLGHYDDDPRRHRGPEHQRCNRATVTHAAGRSRREEQPATGRWSRHWYGGFDVRCPECQRLGRACEKADAA